MNETGMNETVPNKRNEVHYGTHKPKKDRNQSNTMKSIHFGSTEIAELADNSHDFNESKRLVTMSVDNFERRRCMRLECQDSEIELFFFLDRMASTVPPSRPLMAPQRQMSRENIFEGKEEKKQPLEMPERRDFFDASHATQPLIRPERRKSLVISEGSNTSVLPPSEE
jgi:hypothetical protein